MAPPQQMSTFELCGTVTSYFASAADSSSQ